MNMRNWLILPLLLTALPLQAAAGSKLRQGSTLFSQKKYGQAFAQYNEVLQKDPKNESAAFGAGASAYYLKDYKTAARDFEQVVAQNGVRSQDALFNLGNTYYRAGQKEKAAAFYRQAILKNPQDKEAIHNLQILLEEEDKQNNQNNKNDKNKNNNSSNQDQGQEDNQAGGKEDKSEPPQSNSSPEEDKQKKEEQEAAQRVLQMARENEQKSQPNTYREPQIFVEKDW